MMKRFDLYQPEDIASALELFDKLGPDSWKMAGGQDSLDWFKDRAKERTSLDGGALIVLSLLVLFAGPLVKIAATAGLIWGIVTVIKKG